MDRQERTPLDRSGAMGIDVMSGSRQIQANGANGVSSVLQRPAWLIPFDETKAVRIYQRNLPHWQQDGCTYFVTFRLADSIPDGVRQQWEDEQRLWLRARGIDYDGPRGRWRNALEKLHKSEQFRFERHFNQQVQSCLDRGAGACWLENSRCLAVVRNHLFKDDERRFHLGDFVIMPNHVHALITPVAGAKLELILKSIKGASAVECNRLVTRHGTFWQAESHDHIVRSLAQLLAYRDYIASNPTKSGIVVPSETLYRASWMDAWLAS